MNLLALIYLTALSSNVSPQLAISIAFVESGFNPKAEGKKGDTGLFQVRHQLVPESREDLLDAETNMKVAFRILKAYKKECSILDSSWFVCYNRGIAGGKRLADPKNDMYFKRVNKVYKCLKPYTFFDFNKGNERINRCFK